MKKMDQNKENFEFQAPQFCDFYASTDCDRDDTNLDLDNATYIPQQDLDVVGKRSSILCAEQCSSNALKHIISENMDDLILSIDEDESTISERSILQETFSFNIMGGGTTPRAEYSGLGMTKTYNRRTVVQPFSFQQRNEEFLKRKQERLLKAQMNTFKVAEFHARPVPTYILNKPSSAGAGSRIHTTANKVNTQSTSGRNAKLQKKIPSSPRVSASKPQVSKTNKE